MRDESIRWDAVAEELRPIQGRMAVNVAQTGHPFHHRTRNGTVIDCDPRLDRDHLDHLWVAGIPVDVPAAWPHPAASVPHVADWYNTPAGKKWRKQASKPPQQAALWH